MATESTSKLVIDAAARLLVQVHHNPVEELTPRIPEFDDMFAEQCFTIIESQKPAIDCRTEEEQAAIKAALAALPRHASVIQTLRVLPSQERKITRSLFLLRQMIRASEKNGTHGLRPHASLGKGAYLDCLQVQNNITRLEDGHRLRIELGIDSHATVWDLKKLIGEEAAKWSADGGKTFGLQPRPGETKAVKPLHPSTIRLFQMSTSSDLKDSTNGTTLSELKFKSNENLGAFRKSVHLYAKARIVEDDPNTKQPRLTYKAEQALKEIFGRFSVSGEDGERQMTKETCVECTAACTGRATAADDPQVIKFFEAYDPQGTGIVTFSGFQHFFIDACVEGKDLTVR